MAGTRIKFCKRCGDDMPWARKTCPHCGQHQEHDTVPMGAAVLTVYCEGSFADNDDGSSRQRTLRRMKAGDEVLLQAEPTNPHDKNAVRVLTKGRMLSGSRQFAYIPRDSAARIAGNLAQGYRYTAALVRIRGNARYDQSAEILVLELAPGGDADKGARYFQKRLADQIREKAARERELNVERRRRGDR